MTLDPGAIVASVTSFFGTTALAAGAAPVPDSVPGWLPYLTTILGPVLVLAFGKLMAAKAARDRSLAAAKERRAAQLRADNNPANDGEAAKLEDEADALKAEADAFDAASRK